MKPIIIIYGSIGYFVLMFNTMKFRVEFSLDKVTVSDKL